MWFCSSPFGIAHHSTKSSRVLISGSMVFIIRLIGTVVRRIASWLHSLQHVCSALHTETPPFGLSFRKSGRWPPEHSFVGTLVSDPSSFFLAFQSLHFRGCQVGGYGLRSGSGDAWSHSWNAICRMDVMQFLTRSGLIPHQHDDTLQTPKDCSKRGHSAIPPVRPE